MDRMWRKIMSNAHHDPKVRNFVSTRKRLYDGTRETSNPWTALLSFLALISLNVTSYQHQHAGSIYIHENIDMCIEY